MVLAALAGARLLGRLAEALPVFDYVLFGHGFEITRIGLAVGVVILAFDVLELCLRFCDLAVDARWLLRISAMLNS